MPTSYHSSVKEIVASISITLLLASSSGGSDGDEQLRGTAILAPMAAAIDIPPCGNRRQLYSVAPVDPADLSHIIPLGNLNPPAHTFPTAHFYQHIRRMVPDDHSTPSVEVPVVAPDQVWITRISYTENLDQGTRDYSLRFSPCAEHEAYFIHLTTLARKLDRQLVEPLSCNEYTTGGEQWRQCTKDVHTELAAGDAIGTAGGALDRNALDFGASDSRATPSVYANPERWEHRPQQLILVCALDYFAPAVRRRLRSLLGDADTRRKEQPRCGEVAQDAPGTMQGIWFVGGTRELTSEDPHLALAHDNIDPGQGVFSVGTSMQKGGLASATYSFEPSAAGGKNRDFGQIRKRNKVYCYEVRRRFTPQSDPATVLLAMLIDPSTLRLEHREASACGGPPWQMSDDYIEFER